MEDHDRMLAELDLAVAKAEGFYLPADESWTERIDISGHWMHPHDYRPTRDGAEAMRLLEKYGTGTWNKRGWNLISPCSVTTDWCIDAGGYNGALGRGPTPAIAICRAVVALSGTPQGKDTKGQREKI